MEMKSLNYYMRILHRYIGFFLIGFTIIYALSGIVLIYRDTDFLKSEQTIEQQLAPNISEGDLARALHMRRFKVDKTEGDMVYFSNGTYNKQTGNVVYTQKRQPFLIDKFNSLHKRASRNNISHIFSTIYGVLLLFLAISSFWMFKRKTKVFKKGLLFAAGGFVVAVIILFI